jgi:uncharacterized membrane protein (UPF0182 family)
MSYDLGNDADPPAPAPLPAVSAGNLRRITKASLVIGFLTLLVLALWWAKSAYTDLLWFDQLGFRSVFVKILLLKLWLFAAGTILSGIFLSGNLYLAYRLARGESTLVQPEGVIRVFNAMALGSAALVVVIGAPVFGGAASGRWETFLVYFNKISFGTLDPQFSLDATFYIATLRMMHFVQGWFLGLAITVIVTSLALYVALYAIRGLGLVVAPRMLRHLAVMGAFLMLTIAAGHILGVYQLVFSDNGIVPGATYTDVHARIPSRWLMTAIALLAVVGFGASSYYGGLRLMAGAFSLWVLVVILGGLAYPSLFQRFQVDPDEFSRELPYIERNIQATRFAYQLDEVRQVAFPATGRLNPQVIRENRATLDNIRLWDAQPLQDAYNQLQFMELYYQFLNVDSDRYVVDGRLRQVLVSARELDPANLPADAQNWVNQTLQYTHGYGVSMSPATSFTPGEGRPEFFLQGIPIEGKFAVRRPELYYGESTVDFVIVGHGLPEVGPESESSHYEGVGGVPLSSSLRRLAFAWQMGDINVLLSDRLTGDSRIQYRRQIRERVKAIAPFLELDSDPYPVVDENGRLWWFQDAYTTTKRYPYSAPVMGRFNYIRNSVKVVVDAYNGSVDFYAVDAEDPLLRMYSRAFPSLFRDFDEMPVGLRDHMRYPVGIFSAQARMYLRYHVTDPQVFFNQAEQWDIPLETRFGKRGVRVTPSYLVLRNPGEEEEEFVLMLPFTPAGDKKNLVGWMVARNDWPDYGQLISYQVPSNPQVDGPSQVEARIENDQDISQQFTLWEGAGSQIIRGQLLVIPVADTIVYVEPLYLQSEVLAFPELKKVILADASNVVMADTVDQGLAMLAGDLPPVAVAEGIVPTGAGPEQLERLDRVEEAFSGFGEALDELEEALDSLRETLGGR